MYVCMYVYMYVCMYVCIYCQAHLVTVYNLSLLLVTTTDTVFLRCPDKCLDKCVAAEVCCSEFDAEPCETCVRIGTVCVAAKVCCNERFVEAREMSNLC